MPFVLDNSVTMAWCFDDERTEATERILDQFDEDHAFVPSIWAYEVANVLLTAQRKKRITEFDTQRLVARIKDLPIFVDSEPIPINTLIRLGAQHNLSAYDAAYFELAERLGVGLATLDLKLALAAKTAGIPMLAE